jgi:hypothetical protein
MCWCAGSPRACGTRATSFANSVSEGMTRRTGLRYRDAAMKGVWMIELRNLDRAVLAPRGACSSIGRQQNVVFRGFTRSGKSYLASHWSGPLIGIATARRKAAYRPLRSPSRSPRQARRKGRAVAQIRGGACPRDRRMACRRAGQRPVVEASRTAYGTLNRVLRPQLAERLASRLKSGIHAHAAVGGARIPHGLGVGKVNGCGAV